MLLTLVIFIPEVLSSIIQQTFETSCSTVLGDKSGIYISTKTESKLQCAIECRSEEACTSFDFCQTSQEYICRMRSVKSYTCSNDVTECLLFQSSSGETKKDSKTSESEISQFTTLSESEQRETTFLLSEDVVTTNISPVTSLNENILTKATNEEEPNSYTGTYEEGATSSDDSERHDTDNENSYQDLTTNVVTSKFLENSENVGSTSFPTETVDLTSLPTETVDLASPPTETADETETIPTYEKDSTQDGSHDEWDSDTSGYRK